MMFAADIVGLPSGDREVNTIECMHKLTKSLEEKGGIGLAG